MGFDISSTTPAAPSGRTLVTWLSDGAANISGSVPTAEPAVLTTKGDVLGYDTVPDRVPVGSNGQVLTADSAQALGVKWATPGSGSLTTKGDILGYDTAPDRVPVGANDTFLRADSAQALGIRYGALVAGDIPALPESAITNLVSDLALKAPLASPALTGTPTAPTPLTADNSTTLATTAYVKAQGFGTSSLAKYTTSWSAQTSVTVTHNIGTTAVIVQVFDGSGVLVIPESVTVTSSTVVTLTFGAAFTGSVVVIG